MIDKAVLATIGIAAGIGFTGYVGYKILKKKKPLVIQNIKQSLSNLKDTSLNTVKHAKESFQKGYQSTQRLNTASL